MPDHQEMTAVSSKEGKLRFKHLPDFSRFLLSGKAEAFSDEMMRLSREVKLPLLVYFEQMPKEKRREIGRQNITEFLSYLADNKAEEYIELLVDKWISDNLPVIEKKDVAIDDINALGYIRKKCFLKFLPDYTSDLLKNNHILQELETFTFRLQSSCHKAFISLHRETVNESLHFIEKINLTAPGLIYIFDLIELKEIYTNIRVKEYLGYSHHELQQMGDTVLARLIHPADIPGIMQRIHDFGAAADGEIRTHEFRAIAKDGKIHWIRSFESVFKRNEDGLPLQIIGNALDISLEKETAAKLQHREEQLLEAQELAEIGSFEMDMENKLVEVTPQLRKILGLKNDDDLTRFWQLEGVHPADLPKLKSMMDAAMKGDGFYDCEYRYRTDKEEKILWARGIITFINDKPSTVRGTIMDVTNRRHMIQRLERTQELYEQAQKITHIGNWVWLITDNKVEWSDELFRIYGLEPRSEIINFERFLALVHPDDREMVRQRVIVSLESLQPNDFYHRIVLKNGTVKMLHAKGEVLTDENNKPYKMVGTGQDVTEEKIREYELRELNRHLSEKEENISHLIQNAPDAIIVIDEVGKIILWNPQAEKIFGWKADEVIETSLVENIIPPQHQTAYLEEMEKFHEAQEARILNKTMEITALKKSGIEFPASLNISRTVQGGKSAFIAFLRDISEKKKVESELNASKQQLEALYAKLERNYDELESSYAQLIRMRKELADDRTRFLINVMPHIVASASPDGALDYANQHLMDFTGLSFEELKGWGWAKCIYPDDLERLTKAWMSSLETGKPLQIEFRLLAASGEPYWHFARVKPHEDEKGEITIWIATITDIHEHKLLEEKKDEFISIASHELKTPLTSAKAYMQLLENQLDESGNKESLLYVKKANASVTRLNNLISELLDISKIQHGKLALNFSEFDFNEMLDETIELIQQTSPKHKITKTGTVNALIKGDKERLRQVCINLLTNAVKYSPHAERIDVRITNDFDETMVSVTDYGIGIPKSELDKVFGRFYRVKGVSSQYQGLGIGLFISAEIIQRHQGKIWVKSELSKGSTFYFTLPYN